MDKKILYTPESKQKKRNVPPHQHRNGISPFSIGNTSSNGPFSSSYVSLPECNRVHFPWQILCPLLKVKLLVGPTCKNPLNSKGLAKGIRRSPKMCQEFFIGYNPFTNHLHPFTNFLGHPSRVHLPAILMLLLFRVGGGKVKSSQLRLTQGALHTFQQPSCCHGSSPPKLGSWETFVFHFWGKGLGCYLP